MKKDELIAAGYDPKENDPISEAVLRLNKYQSRENLTRALRPLKEIYYLSRKSSLTPLFHSEKQNNGNFSIKPSLDLLMSQVST